MAAISVLAGATGAAGMACAAASAAALNGSQLPQVAVNALARAGVPATSLAAVVHDVSSGRSVLQWQADLPVNPASLTKLLTTAAALDRLGPAYSWATPVWVDGPVAQGVLQGNVTIKGSGDPKLVLEQLWLLLRRLQQQGVRDIRGDIVLDNSAFALPEAAPGDFDGEALRPYNVKPAALLFNFRTVTYSFIPDLSAGVAHVLTDLTLAGTLVDRSVPLLAGPCADWRAALKPEFEAGRTRFAGGYASACGEQSWPVADPMPATFEARLIESLWRDMGGGLQGKVRDGTAPEGKPSFEWRSPPLAAVVRDINKHSNNVMAEQLFLSLALQASPKAAATPESARALLLRWLLDRTGPARGDAEPIIDNGSGLSRSTRISARRLAQVLLQAWDSPVMSELMSSLPVTGLDGTLRRFGAAPGRGHLKTGSLREVVAVAGYVLSNSGKRYVLVAIVNHPQAAAARAALDALVQWTMRDTPSP